MKRPNYHSLNITLCLALFASITAFAQSEKIRFKRAPEPNQTGQTRFVVDGDLNIEGDLPSEEVPSGRAKVRFRIAFALTEKSGALDKEGNIPVEMTIDKVSVEVTIDGRPIPITYAIRRLIGKMFMATYDKQGKMMDFKAPTDLSLSKELSSGEMAGSVYAELPKTPIGVGEVVTEPMELNMSPPAPGAQPKKIDGQTTYKLISIEKDAAGRIAKLSRTMDLNVVGDTETSSPTGKIKTSVDLKISCEGDLLAYVDKGGVILSDQRMTFSGKFIVIDEGRRALKRFAIAGLVILLTVIGLIGWKSNRGQTYLIKRKLHGYGARMDDRPDLFDSINQKAQDDGVRLNGSAALSDIAKALAYAGDSRSARQVVDRISDGYDKAYALRELAVSYVKLGDKESASALFVDATNMAERIGDNNVKVYALKTIAVSVARLGDTAKAGYLLSEAVKVAGRIDGHAKDPALKAIARSYAEIGGTMIDSAMLEEAIKTAGRISRDRDKATTLIAIADSYARLGRKEQARALLPVAIEAAERIEEDDYKAYALRAAVKSYARLGDKEKARALLDGAIKATEQTEERAPHPLPDVYALRDIVVCLGMLGDQEKALALLSEAVETAERTLDGGDKDSVLLLTARSYAGFGEATKDVALLEEATRRAELISRNHNKAGALIAIAGSYARLGQKEQARALLSAATKTAKLIDRNPCKAPILRSIAISFAELGEMTQDDYLLEEAIKTAGRISDDDFGPDQTEETLRAITGACVEAVKSSNDPALYDELRLISEPISDLYKNQALEAILSSKLAITNVGRLRALTSRYGGERGQAMALARILMACSRPDLIGKERSLEDGGDR
jgi:tetratricopeptide (TPR) repeat protein